MPSDVGDRETWLRLQLVLRRAARDVSVHPTTRLPGTVQIEMDLSERIRSGADFAICYADLDHFKEFNDRYGYNNGDKVILLLSRILREIVRALAPTGFVGHIGGDDFIFLVPIEDLEACCDTIVEVFDELIPYQYTEEDRKAGYFLGKDRRGAIHRIPLMTLSIGGRVQPVPGVLPPRAGQRVGRRNEGLCQVAPGDGLRGRSARDQPGTRSFLTKCRY